MKKLLLITIFSISIIQVYAQTLFGNDANNLVKGASEVHLSAVSEIPTLIVFDQRNEIAFEGLEQWFEISFKLDPSFGLKLINTENDKLGFVHYRFSQTFNNIPVNSSMLIVHTKNNRIVSLNCNLVDRIKISNFSATLNESAALDKALNYIGAKQYKWQIPEEEAFIKREQNDPNATFFPKGEMMFASNESANFRNVKLAYRFDIYAHQPHARKYVYVDATTGEIIKFEDRILHTNANGTAVTAYSGTQSITTDFTGSTYRLRETGRGLGIETYDMRLAGTTYGNSVDFTDADNTWNNVNANKDQYATDGHLGTEKTYDYYWNTFGRNSINNSGLKLLSYVHANLVAFGYGDNVNAFWDGSRMTYGDGNTTYTPLTSMDIAGHEITHGLTEYTANLNYSNESGALNEGFSDIFGTTIEFYTKPLSANWLIGEDIGAAFRSMSNPKTYSQPNTYLGQYWATGTADNGGVHTNSGVLNYWYYLVSQGGTGTNDNGNSYNFTGVGMTKAAAIAYRTLTNYLVPTSNYAACRTFSLQAATDLYGACSAEVTAVTNAWYAVGIGAASSQNPPVIAAQGATTFCAGQSVVLSTSNVSGVTYQWKLNGNNIAGATTNSYTANQAGNYTLSATSCSTTSTSNAITVTVSTISASIAPAGNALSCNGGPVLLTANATSGYQVQWNKDGSPISGANSTTYNATQSGNYTITLSGTNNSAQTFTSASTAVSIPDNNCTGASKTISVSGYTTNINTAGITIKINLTHTYDGDLRLALVAPNGDILGLSNGAGGSGDNFVNTIFSDAGSSSLSSGTAPFTGTYKPWTSTYTFCTTTTNKTSFASIGNGSINPNGNWILRVADIASTDVGTIGTWEITFPSYTTPSPNCGPFTSTATNVTISNITSPTISTSGATTFCEGGSVVLTSSSATGNVWSNGATSQSITVTSAGNYSVTVTNGNGCSATSAATAVTVSALPATPTISTSGATTFCDGGNVVLTSSSATGNVWSNGATSQSITVTSAGNYTVTVTNGNGCSATSAATAVTVNAMPATPTISTSGATTFCDGGNVVLTSSSATGNVWSNGATSQSITVTSAGNYSVTVTNGNDCSASSSATAVTVNASVIPTISISTANTTICENATTIFTASVTNGGSIPAYQWKINGQNVGTNSPTFSSSTLTNGQSVSCVLSSNAVCANPASANSNNITLTVNNCSGVPTTKLRSADCGKQNIALNASILCDAVAGATNYDFEFTNLTTNAVGVKTTTANSVGLSTITPAIQFGTQYNVRVRAKVGGVYGNYGPVCLIGTVCNPSICGVPSTQLRTSDCGKLNFSPLTGQIIADAVAAASQYEFEFRNISTNVVYATKLQTSNVLVFSTVSPAMQWNTQYNVKVRAYIAGVAGVYGANCVIGFIPDPSVSGVPNTQLSTASCGVTNLALTGSITCLAVTGAGSYEWEFRNQANTSVVATKTTTSTSLNLSSVVGLNWNTQYNVRVRAYIGTVAGTYNVSCLIGIIPDPALNGVPSTKIRTSDCGKLNFGLGGFAVADVVSGAAEYEFEIRDVITNAFIANKLQASNVLTFSTVPAFTWNTQYKISVRARISTTWGNFGTACTIGFICNPSLCGVPVTALRTTDCGKLNFNLSTGFAVANTVPGATLYEFEITDISTNTIVSTQARTTMNLYFNTITPALVSTKQYSIRVRATISGVVGTYGSACTIGFVSGSRESIDAETMNDNEIFNDNIFNLSLYPNPFNQQFTLLIQSLNSNKAQVQIIDMMGNIVWNEQVNTNLSLSLGNDLATGTYIVKVLNQSGEQAIHKMIKVD